MNPEYPLILASTSPYREQLLRRLQLKFECEAPGVDESRQTGESGAAMVTRLAQAKALRVAESRRDAWVIGSDQTALLGEDTLGKPGSHAQCVAQLSRSSGRAVQFLTAVSLVNASTGQEHGFLDVTHVKFRQLDRATIERYVSLEQPLDCAGGFKSEGLGITLFESIHSEDPTALLGLPLIRTSGLLRSAGFTLP